VKHAFPNGRLGVVTVTVGPADGGSTVIQVANDGVGVPKRPETGDRSLGLRLVESSGS
jgi:two-component sensor histidine kinase